MSSALDDFCGSTFWDESQVWNTTDPDLSECFQKTVLVWLPCSFLWVCSPFSIYQMTRFKSSSGVPWSYKTYLQMLLLSILLMVECVNFGDAVSRSSHGQAVMSIDYCTPLIKLFTFILAASMMIMAKRRKIYSLDLLFIFWLLLVFCSTVRVRTLLKRAIEQNTTEPLLEFVYFCVHYPTTLMLLLLSTSADIPKQDRVRQVNLKISPEDSSSFVSKFLYSWFDRMAWTGFRRPITMGDLWTLSKRNRTATIAGNFQEQWQKEQLKVNSKAASYIPGYQRLPKVRDTRAESEPSASGVEEQEPSCPDIKPLLSLSWVLWRTFGMYFCLGTLYLIMSSLLAFANPALLEKLIDFVSHDEPMWRGFFYSALLFLAAIFQSLLMNKHFYITQCMAVRMHAAIMTAVYKKSLYLSNAAKRSSTVGEIVNLMAVDSERLTDLVPEMPVLFSAPIQLCLATYMLWNVLGVSIFAGLLVLIILVPYNIYVVGLTEKIELDVMKRKDERIKSMNEVLSGIKVLKLYTWEMPFFHQVDNIRSKEISLMRRNVWLHALIWFSFNCAPVFILCITFATYIYIDESHVLNASTIFVSLSLFNIMKEPLSLFPILLGQLVQIRVSLKRLTKFMNSEEIDINQVQHEKTKDDVIIVTDGIFSWEEGKPPTLHEITFRVSQGQLAAVVGPVGAGKSSLISALLGEMEKASGHVNTNGTLAYVPQQAWIQNATLKDNILFGQKLDEEWYQTVLEACALLPDLDMLPGRDQTEIGEKGINLSGGQKQRVSLARAVYCKADLYFLDDPLSAVDSHVGKHIFDKVIGPEGILSKKTRVLVTHGLSYLPRTDFIIVLDDGRITEQGSYRELIEKKGVFAELANTYLSQAEGEGAVSDKVSSAAELSPVPRNYATGDAGFEIGSYGSHCSINSDQKFMKRQTSIMSEDGKALEGAFRVRFPSRQVSKMDCPEELATVPNLAGLITEEISETGQVGLRVYYYYIKNIGFWMAVASIVVFGGGWCASFGANVWLSAWSNDPPNDYKLRNMRLSIYSALGVIQAMLIFAGYTLMGLGMLRASRNLHGNMLHNILRSPMSFFDTTPLGRVVNRFSRDVDTVDSTMPNIIIFLIEVAFQLIGIMVILCVATPFIAAVIFPVAIFYYLIQRIYISTSRQLKRLESVTHSPIYSHFSETLSGLPTLRAYKCGERFMLDFQQKVDTHHSAVFPSYAARRWLSLRLDTLGDIVILFAAIFAVQKRGSIDPGTLGLSISYSMTITFVMGWVAKLFCELETYIVSVERIKQYTETPSEAAWNVEAHKPGEMWPDNGVVAFREYSTRYREGLNLVLNEVTCDIVSMEKVGIVGRTGAGKSSLTLALFRLIESAGGRILIDGLDIAHLGLHDLRSKLTIIPQDPVLFSGTLRMNLDPFDQYSDIEIWRALEHSHLKTFVESLPEGLIHDIAESGDNISVGQRQLVCLARALLRKTKVLILDEATAAVDLETDDLIQATIRKQFADCTVLTIAHRLNTIMDSTRILVLDQGVVKEFDSPSNLLANEASLFYSMAKEAGLV